MLSDRRVKLFGLHCYYVEFWVLLIVYVVLVQGQRVASIGWQVRLGSLMRSLVSLLMSSLVKSLLVDWGNKISTSGVPLSVCIIGHGLIIGWIDGAEVFPIISIGLGQGIVMSPITRVRPLMIVLDGGGVVIVIDIRWELMGLIVEGINRVVDVGRNAE